MHFVDNLVALGQFNSSVLFLGPYIPTVISFFHAQDCNLRDWSLICPWKGWKASRMGTKILYSDGG